MLLSTAQLHSIRNLRITRRMNMYFFTSSKTPTRSSDESKQSTQDMMDKCLSIRSSIQQLNDKYNGPLEKSAQRNTVLPFVFLLGNHSSGKSSFINYVLQKRVQVTGVAPTDDGFTIIVPGQADVDRNGPAFVSDPDMGFDGLHYFGPQLVQQTHLKIRSDLAMKDFMIVDTPGMIDSPNLRTRGVSHGADRGYDFEAVCRWYAERADVILLFFDPDKPGTTGETLAVLTSSLLGLDHKLHILLNKADQFHKIHDFARAYGSLCWNLSKVIPRKDLPRIYTMCLPAAYQGTHGSAGGGGNGTDLAAQSHSGFGILDLETVREEIVREVFNAPNRRVDNEISRLSDAAHLLLLHTKVLAEIQRQVSAVVFQQRLVLAAEACTTALITVLAFGGPDITVLPELAVGGAVMGLGVMSATAYLQHTMLIRTAKRLMEERSLEEVFKKLYVSSRTERDEFILSLWKRVKLHMLTNIRHTELVKMSRVVSSDVTHVERVVETVLSELRREAGPSYDGYRRSLHLPHTHT